MTRLLTLLAIVLMAAAPPSEKAMRIAHLVYGAEATTTKCFSGGYLDLLARETRIDVDHTPVKVPLESKELYNFPFAILSGEGRFTLTDEQFTALRSYLERGGFLLASAGCSNKEWNGSFREQIEQVFPDHPLEPIDISDEIFQSLFKIESLSTRTHNTDVQLYALRLDGRIVLVYSPEGLNDTGNAGGGCCCCGGSEIRDAKYLNANILAYVLTH